MFCISHRARHSLSCGIAVLLCVFLTLPFCASQHVIFLDTRTKLGGTESFYYDVGKDVAYSRFRRNSEYVLPNGITFGWKTVFSDPNSDAEIEPTVNSVIDALTGDSREYVALLGPHSEEVLLQLMTHAVINEKHLVSYAPLTRSMAARHWSPLTYFTTADTHADLMALLAYMTNEMGMRRLGFIYIGDPAFANEAKLLLHKQLDNSDFAKPVYYTGEPNTEFNQAALDIMLSTQPQAIMLFGEEGIHLKAVFKYLITTLQEEILLIPTPLTPLLSTWYQQYAQQEVVTLPSTKLLFSTSYPFISADPTLQTRFKKFIGQFMDGFVNYTTSDDYNLQDYCAAHDIAPCEVDEALDPIMSSVAAGYTDAMNLLHALTVASGTRVDAPTAQDFQKFLFDYQLLKLDEGLMLGVTAGECVDEYIKMGNPCECNQGAHRVMINSLYNASEDLITFQNVPNSDFYIPASECYTDNFLVKAAIGMVGLAVSSKDGAKYMWGHYFGVIYILTAVLKQTTVNRYILHQVPSTVEEVQKSLNGVFDDFVMSMLVSPVPPELAEDRDLFILDPIYDNAHLHRKTHNHIYLSTTLEQEMSVMVQYLANKMNVERRMPPVDVGSIHAVFRVNDDYDVMTGFLSAMLEHFDQKLSTKTQINDDEDLVDKIPHKGTVFVIGMTPQEIKKLGDLLLSSPNLMVVIPFDKITLHYYAFLDTFSDHRRIASNRLLFATNIPHWRNGTINPRGNMGDEDVNSVDGSPMTVPMLTNFLELLTDDSLHTPAAFRAYMMITVLNSVVSREARVSASLLPTLFYGQQLLTVDGMQFGPYEKHCDNGAITCDDMIYDNDGARNIAVWSFMRALDPMVTTLSDVTNPSDWNFKTTSANTTKFPQWVIIAVSVFAFLVVAAVVTLLLFCCCGCLSCGKGDARDNRNAPKDKDVPVTLVFTDIESSTALWALTPDAMKDAVEAHHKMIRALIVKYRCYEVKTIGDSFMIACGNAFSAVQLARDLQVEFLSGGDYDTSRIDAAYAQIALFQRRKSSMFGPKLPLCTAPGYRTSVVWKGLRVRVGMHTGLADIRYDEVTKGYDYYGDTANTAARTESIGAGGQVIMTEFTYNNLSSNELAELNITALGSHSLRGVPMPIDMYQLNSVAGREYPSLRSLTAQDSTEEGEEGDVAQRGDSHKSESCHSRSVQSGASRSVVTPLRSCEASLSSTGPFGDARTIRYTEARNPLTVTSASSSFAPVVPTPCQDAGPTARGIVEADYMGNEDDESADGEGMEPTALYRSKMTRANTVTYSEHNSSATSPKLFGNSKQTPRNCRRDVPPKTHMSPLLLEEEELRRKESAATGAPPPHVQRNGQNDADFNSTTLYNEKTSFVIEGGGEIGSSPCDTVFCPLPVPHCESTSPRRHRSSAPHGQAPFTGEDSSIMQDVPPREE